MSREMKGFTRIHHRKDIRQKKNFKLTPKYFIKRQVVVWSLSGEKGQRQDNNFTEGEYNCNYGVVGIPNNSTYSQSFPLEHRGKVV